MSLFDRKAAQCTRRSRSVEGAKRATERARGSGRRVATQCYCIMDPLCRLEGFGSALEAFLFGPKRGGMFCACFWGLSKSAPLFHLLQGDLNDGKVVRPVFCMFAQNRSLGWE